MLTFIFMPLLSWFCFFAFYLHFWFFKYKIQEFIRKQKIGWVSFDSAYWSAPQRWVIFCIFFTFRTALELNFIRFNWIWVPTLYLSVFLCVHLNRLIPTEMRTEHFVVGFAVTLKKFRNLLFRDTPNGKKCLFVLSVAGCSLFVYFSCSSLYFYRSTTKV